jgi:hypothetical protein
MRVRSIAARAGRPKEDTDRADLRRLLLARPELREPDGLVAERLRARGAGESVLALWRELVGERFEPDEDDEY